MGKGVVGNWVGWVGGWVGGVEETKAVGMRYCRFGFGWVGGWVGYLGIGGRGVVSC